MTAIQHAKELYVNHCSSELFYADLKNYLKYGFVISFPTIFILAKPINKKSKNIDENWVFNSTDAWFIDLLIKKNNEPLGELLRYIPYELPFIGWRRYFKRNNEKVVFFRYSKITKHIKPK